MFAEITAAIQSLKTLYGLVRATQSLSNSTEILTAVSDVQQKLMDANAAALASQEKQAAFAEKVRELETQLRDSEDWKNQMQSYELFQFPTKALAYKLKSQLANTAPMHYLCTACADKKKKTILQPISTYLHCPECKSNIDAEIPPPRPQRRQISGGQSWML